MKALHEALDAIALSCGDRRLTSDAQTAECPIWDTIRGYWVESDAQLRERLKAGLR